MQNALHDSKGLWDPDVLRDVTTDVRNRLPSGFRSEEAVQTRGLIIQPQEPSSLSFVYLTNGLDRELVRLYRKGFELSSLAAACATAPSRCRPELRDQITPGLGGTSLWGLT